VSKDRVAPVCRPTLVIETITLFVSGCGCRCGCGLDVWTSSPQTLTAHGSDGVRVGDVKHGDGGLGQHIVEVNKNKITTKPLVLWMEIKIN